MCCKANLVGDSRSAALIMESRSPAEQQRLGRRVEGAMFGGWDSVKRGVVYKGNLEKFSQNKWAREQLFGTKGKNGVGKKTAAEERDGVECCEMKKCALTIGREPCWLNRRSGYQKGIGGTLTGRLHLCLEDSQSSTLFTVRETFISNTNHCY